uniref:Protein kinase domain-containing protein n=1 Tax=Oryzias latipes TaxID=8090 RepID=A0A3B3IKJ2_ORYLA
MAPFFNFLDFPVLLTKSPIWKCLLQTRLVLLGVKSSRRSYLVEKFLGEGTFGKVAKCKNLSTNKEVAIKIIKNGFDNAGEKELKALIEISKLDADKYNLVKCVDVFRYKSHVCIVFEILDQSLYDFLEDRTFRPLFVQEIRAVAWQLLIALKGLKRINLVHCDIKLDNIMLVNQDSKPFRVKLIDFGLASKTKDIPTGTRLQNICFRAPEVILGLPLDERLDMWTVGYVLALLYTGFCIHPWDSEYNIIRGLYTNKFFTRTEEDSKQLIDLLKQMLEIIDFYRMVFSQRLYFVDGPLAAGSLNVCIHSTKRTILIKRQKKKKLIFFLLNCICISLSVSIQKDF